MLKGIPKIISPELLKVLCEMGHGDRILIADGNFPSESVGKNAKVIRADGHGGAELLEAILTLMPLDSYVEKSVKLMQVVPGDPVKTPIWDEYAEIVKRVGGCDKGVIGDVERMAFYEEARSAYAIVATSESALYANIMLQKGVI
ncbi:MAG: fucose isomerase [Ruminococcaceae bacterium]|nr:fucose isomerase [Oscillospiraceae bacterium]